MSEHNTLPATARDALIVELLSDVGRLHDDIKGIPKALMVSMKESLDIVADAVEDAEDTALLLQQRTKDIIHATTSKAAFDIGVELTEAIHTSLGRVFEPALNSAAIRVDSLEKRIVSLSGHVRDAQATRINYIVLLGFIVLAVTMVGCMGWLANSAQDVNETNKWFYDEYKAQQKIIDSLPEGVRQKIKG